jgi:hypothetical protein
MCIKPSTIVLHPLSDYTFRLDGTEQVHMQGYQLAHGGLLLSVFSAPNYCGQVGNLGSVVRFEQAGSMNPIVSQFEASKGEENKRRR